MESRGIKRVIVVCLVLLVAGGLISLPVAAADDCVLTGSLSNASVTNFDVRDIVYWYRHF